MAKEYSLIDLKHEVKKFLKKKRYAHTIGVMYTSASLAMAYGEDMAAAQTAGLLHDCAKGFSDEEQLNICRKFGIPISDAEERSPFLLHAKLGAYLAEHKYGIKDECILNAIARHTTGKPNMTVLEKIIFTADYIEPQRKELPRLSYIRRLAFRDLNLCIYEILHDTLMYLEETNPQGIDETTSLAYQFYKGLKDNKKGI